MSAPEPPSTLGPFRMGRSEYESEAGTVMSGETPDGRPVELVRLGLGPSCDPAARDRFRACVASLGARSPGAVLGADLDSAWPWVALAPGAAGADARMLTGAPAGTAAQLLAAAVPAGPQVVPARGPEFSPYWRGRRPPALAGPAAVPGRGWAWERWAVVALVLLVLLLLLLWWLLTRPLATAPQPAPSPVPTVSQLPLPLPEPNPGPPSSVPSGAGSDAPVVRLAPAGVEPPPPR